MSLIFLEFFRKHRSTNADKLGTRNKLGTMRKQLKYQYNSASTNDSHKIFKIKCLSNEKKVINFSAERACPKLVVLIYVCATILMKSNFYTIPFAFWKQNMT